MTNTQAILIGAALVAGAVFATAGHLSAQTYGVIGQYQLMHHSNASANAGVFASIPPRGTSATVTLQDINC